MFKVIETSINYWLRLILIVKHEGFIGEYSNNIKPRKQVFKKT